MANRYWVGGTGNWSNITHWSLTSGGASGVAVPTSADDVFFDSHSGLSGGTVTMDYNNGGCKNFTSTTGVSYVISQGNAISPYGSMTLESGITFSANPSGLVVFYATDSQTITTAGVIMPSPEFKGIGGRWTFQDNFATFGEFYQENGTVLANNYNVTATDYYFYVDIGFTPTLTMGSGTWEATNGDWYVDEYNGQMMTVTANTSTIKLTDNTAKSILFYGAGKTYYNVWFARGNNTHNINVVFSNTFTGIRDTGTSAHIVTFDGGSTTTVSTFNISGSVGNLISLNLLSGSNFTLSCPSGIISCDYLDISNSNATGGATWYAGYNSINRVNNGGWIFTSPPVTSIGNAAYDDNNVPTKLGILNTNGTSTVRIQVNPATNALKISDGTSGSDLGPTNAKHDENGVPTLMGVSSADGITPIGIYADSFGNMLTKSI